MFKIVGGVKRRVGVVAGETLTITGNDDLEEDLFEIKRKFDDFTQEIIESMHVNIPDKNI